VLAIQVTNQTTVDSLRNMFDRTAGQANLVVIPSHESNSVLDERLLWEIENFDGIKVAAPSLAVQTMLAQKAGSWQIAFSMTGIAEGNYLELYGIDPDLDPQVRVYELAAGRFPKIEKYEVLITKKLAADESLEIGEDLSILIPEGTARLRIVGLLNDEGIGLLNNSVVGFTSLQVLQDLFSRSDEIDEIALLVSPTISDDPGVLDNYKEELEQHFSPDAEVVYPTGRGQLVSQMLSSYQLGLALFSTIAICVGAFLIYNAFSMTVAERTKEIGMLRAIGMRRRQILGMVFSEAIILSIIGSIAGVAVGYYLSRGLISMLGDLLIDQEGFISIDWKILAQSVAVGIGITCLAALIPAYRAASISPLEALRVKSRSREKTPARIWITGIILLILGWLFAYIIEWPEELLYLAGNLSLLSFFLGATFSVPLAVMWLEGLTRLLARLFYRNEGAIGSANIKRSVGRTTLTVAALMIALTMIISINSMAFSMKVDIQDWIDNALGGDLYVRAPLPMRESFANELSKVPGVSAVTPARVLNVHVPSGFNTGDAKANDEYYFNAIDVESFRKVADMEFVSGQSDPEENWRRLQQGRAIFISNQVADRNDLHRGDEIVFLTKRGPQSFYIVAEVVDFSGTYQMVYGTYPDLHRWFGKKGVDRFTITVEPGYSVEEISSEIQNRFRDRRHISVQSTEIFKTGILDLVDQSYRLFDVLVFIGVIIGSLGVVNTLTMNVMERQREIGGLRSLGMTRRQVLRMVLAEALAMGIMGGIYGIFMGYITAKVLIRGSNQMVGYDLVFQFTPNPFLTGIVIAVVIVQLAAFLPARRAATTNLIKAIQHE